LFANAAVEELLYFKREAGVKDFVVANALEHNINKMAIKIQCGKVGCHTGCLEGLEKTLMGYLGKNRED
jgi:hypothetical protein